MSSRVLSTPEAKTAIKEMQSIVNGSLQDELNRLDKTGQTLSDPNVWDGNLAQQFRGDQWPSMKKALDDLTARLNELRERVQQINANIMSAGGNEYE
jgi:uncharacterized protein YukE